MQADQEIQPPEHDAVDPKAPERQVLRENAAGLRERADDSSDGTVGRRPPALKPKDSPPAARYESLVAYGTAVALTLLTLWARLMFGTRLEGPAMIVFTIPVIVSAYRGGLGPGLVATATAFLGASYYLLPPLHSFAVTSSTQRWQQAILLFSGTLISAICEALRRARSRAEASQLAAERGREALRESEELFSKAFRLSPDCVAIVRLSDRTVIKANEALCRLWGSTPENVIGKPTKEYSSWVNEDGRVTFMQNLRQTGECLNHETELRLSDGRLASFNISARLIDFNDDACVLSVMRDITERNRAEEARLASDARYRTLFDYAPDGIVIADPRGYYLDANASICRMLGYAREELVRLHSTDVVAPAEISQIEPALNALKTTVDYHREWQLRRKDGSIFAAEVIGTAMPDGNIMAMIRDITERKRTEAALQASGRRFQALIEQSTDSISMVDAENRILYLSPAVARVEGFTPEELVGRNGIENTHPDDLPLLHGIVGQLLANPGQPFPVSWRRRHKNGQWLWLEGVATNLLHDPDVGAIVTNYRDVTGRRSTDEALTAERTLLRTVIDLLPDYIYVKDVQGRFLACNAASARLLGASDPAGLTGKTDADFYAPELAAEFRKDEQAVREGAPLVDKEEPFIRGDGTREFILTTKLPLRNTAGEVTGLVGYGRNVTAAKLAEEKIQRLNSDLERRVIERTEQLEAANKELEAFSYSVSHDLRAPLRTVDGFSQAVLEDYGNLLPAEGQRYLGTIREGAQRMGALIDDLLEFARLSRQSLNKRTVDTGSVVRRVVEEMESQRAGRQVEIRIGELAPCQGDPALLKQVWVNLISNALKYSRKTARAVVEIGCTQDADGVVFHVRDNGTGFDMQYAHKLFGVFQRLHRVEEYEGTGVGLAIVQRVINRHGGRVWAEGVLDRGATFYFTLPEGPNS